MNAPTQPVPIAGDRALAVAQADAQADAVRAYGDLSRYRIQLVLEPDGWHVDYTLKDPKWKGGGPHYVIDAQTGVILAKRYEQ
ncbi:MAG TPA: hypothetical protein VKE74_29995 [Gemmataceae bacterium]|nr:hypothetical protein [Gemmataceae bacterium]